MPVKRPSHEVQSYFSIKPRFFGVRRGYHFNEEFRIKAARERRAIVGVSMGINGDALDPAPFRGWKV